MIRVNIRSSVSGTKFDCIFEFDVGEEKVINCKSTNVIYLLSCKCCYSQYVGETVQELKDRSLNIVGLRILLEIREILD